jgi:hypothetical protein
VVVAAAVDVSTDEASVVRAVVVSTEVAASEVVAVEVGSTKDSVVEMLTSVKSVLVEPIAVEVSITVEPAEVEVSATSVSAVVAVESTVEEADSVRVLEVSVATDDEITSETTAKLSSLVIATQFSGNKTYWKMVACKG